jgi:hypothetical protein
LDSFTILLLSQHYYKCWNPQQKWLKQKVFIYFRGVAQPGSALVWGARGRKFKSCHPDKSKTLVQKYQVFLCPNVSLLTGLGTKKAGMSAANRVFDLDYPHLRFTVSTSCLFNKRELAHRFGHEKGWYELSEQGF